MGPAATKIVALLGEVWVEDYAELLATMIEECFTVEQVIEGIKKGMTPGQREEVAGAIADL